MFEKKLNFISTYWLVMLTASVIMGCLRYSFHVNIPFWLVTIPLWIMPLFALLFIILFLSIIIIFFVFTKKKSVKDSTQP